MNLEDVVLGVLVVSAVGVGYYAARLVELNKKVKEVYRQRILNQYALDPDRTIPMDKMY